MRPLELTISGFRSHEGVTEISFRDRSLVAIVGPTGAGKSSILDGISFALYARTPRLARDSRKLICSRSTEAHVRYAFEIDGRTYTITRSLHRDKAGHHALEDDAGERVIGEANVTRSVEGLLGMEFEAFSSAVILAQGRFAEFLEAANKKRMQILKAVFRFDQIDELQKAASARASNLKEQLARIEGALSQIPEDAEEQLALAREQAKEAIGLIEQLERARPKEAELEKAIETAEREQRELQEQAAALDRVTTTLPAVQEMERRAADERAMTTALSSARERATVAESERSAAAKELGSVAGRVGSESALIEARVHADALARAAAQSTGLEKEIEEAIRALEGLKNDAARAEAERVAAEETVTAARAEFKLQERNHAAHALRDDLVPGEPCPVCEYPVGKVPSRRKPVALASADKAEKSAEAAARKAVEEAATAAAAASRAAHRLEGLAERLQQHRDGIAAGEKALSFLGKNDDPATEVATRLEEIAAARTAIDLATETYEEARQAVDRITEESRAVDEERQRFHAALTGISARLDIEGPGLGSAIGELLDFRGDLEKIAGERRDGLKDKLERVAQVVEKAIAELDDLHHSLPIPDDARIEEAITAAVALKTRFEATAADLADKLAAARELNRERKTVRDRQDLFEQLKKDFTDQHFIKFLLEDKRRLLSELASERLRAMTERYRFDDDAEFNVIDELDADKLRTVDTLSGGETFLASLALALGLAEAVSRHGGRLQCFFLDEGFGSLDAEALEHALGGIERIVARDRLIGLVSHVPALRDRVEDKIVLDKTPDGMTKIVAGAIV